MPETPLERYIRKQSWVEPIGTAAEKATAATYRALGPAGPPLRNLLHGTYLLRHPLHPAITDIPIGAWTVGVVADYAAHFTHAIPESAGDIALIVGLLFALLAFVTGITDFLDTFGLERRFANAHGITMTAVILIYTLSLFLRWFGGAGAHPVAVALSTIGWLVLLAGAWIGGHEVFGIAYPVNRNAVIESGPDDWTRVGPADSVPADGMVMVQANGMNVLLARNAGAICALSDICTHVGAPLHEGSLEGGVVTCPWHASKFRLRDGHCIGGPATMDLPALHVRETDGVVEVKLSEPLHEP
jgi:nitrite reductase/ring-hydroxylating ferredoxin subunit/uncharacterized membrane protein